MIGSLNRWKTRFKHFVQAFDHQTHWQSQWHPASASGVVSFESSTSCKPSIKRSTGKASGTRWAPVVRFIEHTLPKKPPWPISTSPGRKAVDCWGDPAEFRAIVERTIAFVRKYSNTLGSGDLSAAYVLTGASLRERMDFDKFVQIIKKRNASITARRWNTSSKCLCTFWPTRRRATIRRTEASTK